MFKRKVLKFIAILTAVSCLSGCGSNITTGGDVPKQTKSTAPGMTGSGKEEGGSYDIAINTESLLSTNIGLVDSVSQAYHGENVMISGMSVNYALAMLANGAGPEALVAIEDFLGMDIASANEYYSAFLNRGKTDTRNKLIISNSFWTDETLDYDVWKSYTQLLEDTYHAEIREIPINAKGIKEVNKWADKATDGLVKNALSPNDLTEDTVSIIINAILLDGKWESPYRENQIRDAEFTLADGEQTTVKGMYSNEYFYYENEYATGFRKDYDEKEYYMIAVLPKEVGDFKMADLDIEGLIKSGKSTGELNAELSTMLPQTDFEVKYNLSEILKSTGLERIFDKNYNNFPGIYDNDKPEFRSYASAIIQNDRLIIDGEGTKAAAVTSIVVDNCDEAFVERNYLQVYLDRPFAILLMDGATDEPLFIAKIVHP